MSDISEISKRFAIPRIVRIEPGRGGLTRLLVESDLAQAEMYLHGAHITHFQPRDAEPILFLSRQSMFESGKPIRGGIPLVFPWFGAGRGQPRTPPHGFARLREWQIESCDARADGSVRIALTFTTDEETLKLWPFTVRLRLIVIIGKTLDATLEIKNLSQQPMEFEEALHTYIHVGDVRKIAVNGLKDVEYADRTASGQHRKQVETPIRIAGETDRAYLNTQSACTIEDPVMKRTIRIEKENSAVSVLWNPWAAKAMSMPDFGDDEWVSMVCLEAANALDYAVTLAPASTHRMSTRIGLAV